MTYREPDAGELAMWANATYTSQGFTSDDVAAKAREAREYARANRVPHDAAIYAVCPNIEDWAGGRFVCTYDMRQAIARQIRRDQKAERKAKAAGQTADIPAGMLERA